MRIARAYVVTAFVLLAVGYWGTGLAFAEQQPVKQGAIALIEQDFKRGELSLDEKALLQVKAIRQPDQLPAKYRLAPREARLVNGRSATPALLSIMRDWDKFQPETQAALEAALDRPSGAYTYDSPSGFFKLHYNVTGTNAVSTVDNNSNGVPDYVERIASYVDSSLAKHRALGYLDPPSDGTAGGDSKYDVYFLNMSYYGFTQAESPGPAAWFDYTSYLVMNTDYFGFPSNTDPEGQQAGAAKATAAHEFHHAIQYAYNVGEVLWYMELDATYMEDIVFDHVNDNYNYLPYYMGDPEETLMQEDGAHPYASFIYGLYLSQRFDTSMAVAVWEGARFHDLFQTVADTLDARYGVDRDSSFVEFTYWNYITGTRDDGMHHDEASEYPTMVLAAQYMSYPVYEMTAAKAVSGYGASYIQFRPGSQTGSLHITFDGSDSRHWAAYVIKSSAVNSHEFEPISLASGTYDGDITIDHFENYYSVTLVAVNLSPYSLSASFDYSADVSTPYALSSTVLTDSLVCVNETRQFEYRVSNASETGEVFAISYFDNMGWMTPNTVDVYIGSGESATVQAPVRPPAGTAIGVVSSLQFKAEVKNAPYAYDIQLARAVTIPHRGDAVTDGKINLADITFVIADVYLGGSSTDPSWVEDFTCDGKINLADITAIIARVYLGGSHSRCDPF